MITFEDGKGNRITTHAGMLRYYANCPMSTKVIKNFLTKDIEVFPDIHIMLKSDNPRVILFYKVFPGYHTCEKIFVSDRQVDTLRGLLRRKKSHWTWRKTGDTVDLWRKGFVLPINPEKRKAIENEFRK